MVEKGARHIALVSRGGTTDKVKRLTAKLEKLGANVTVHKCDVGNKNEVENLVATVSHNKALIRGLIHSAMVLHVSFIYHMPLPRLTLLGRTCFSRR